MQIAFGALRLSIKVMGSKLSPAADARWHGVPRDTPAGSNVARRGPANRPAEQRITRESSQYRRESKMASELHRYLCPRQDSKLCVCGGLVGWLTWGFVGL